MPSVHVKKFWERVMFKFLKNILLVTVLSGTISILNADNISADRSYRDSSLTKIPDQHPLAFNKSKQMILRNNDGQHRATDAHIQLSYSEKPTKKRAQRLEYNPAGWHNYRFKYEKSNGKVNKEWLFNRGHLVGYQFSGLNDEARNLVPETAYLNTGALKSMNDSNKKSMLYYENHLEDWLKKNKSYHLDYQVTPLYKNNELLPRQIRLAYVGYKDSGKKIKINLHSYREEKGNDDTTIVYLDNSSPNAIIDYSNGTARNTLNKEKTLKEDREAAIAASELAARSASESVARESSISESRANESVVTADAPQQNQSVVAPAADDNINNTSGYKWAIQDGFDWQTRKGHSTRIAAGGSLPIGYHWQVQ